MQDDEGSIVLCINNSPTQDGLSNEKLHLGVTFKMQRERERCPIPPKRVVESAFLKIPKQYAPLTFVCF